MTNRNTPNLVEQFAAFNRIIAAFFERNSAYMDEFEEAAEGEGGDEMMFELASLYIDFINIFLVTIGVRNGTQLEVNTTNEVLPEPMKHDLLQMINGLPNTRAVEFEGRAIIVWNPTRVTDAELENSWAASGNVGRANTNIYYVNTAKLLGTPLGYPTYTHDPNKMGTWNIRLTISLLSTNENETSNNLASKETNSLCGGAFDITIPDDLRGAEYIYQVAKQLEGQPMPYPFLNVKVDSIEMEVRRPEGGTKRRRTRGGATRRTATKRTATKRTATRRTATKRSTKKSRRHTKK